MLLAVLVGIVGSGWILADRLMPAAVGAPSTTLPLADAQTAIDREVLPLVEHHAGATGVVLLPEGLDAFAARVMATRQAGRSLDVMYYIWHDDITGRLLARELWQAAERGVRVRLLLDDLNAVDKDVKWLALDSHRNIEIRLYNPFRNRSGLRRVLELLQRVLSMNHRMHNKAWIADGRAAIVGGRNIGVEYFDASEQANFRDLDALVFGPATADASAVFDGFWNSEAVVPVAALRRKPQARIDEFLGEAARELDSAPARSYMQRVAQRRSLHDYASGQLRPHWTHAARIVSDPPVKREREAHTDWLVDLIAAQLRATQRQALVISPYFVPGQGLTDEMVQAARAGKQVGVITNSLAANDVIAVHGGYARYRVPLLEGGVQLHELRARPTGTSASAFGSSGASLHTKAYVIDGRHGFIGSFNLDPRSAFLNTEMGLMFDDAGIAAELAGQYALLSRPESSYWLYLEDGALRWLDRTQQPPRIWTHEPEASRGRRLAATAIGQLPLESQL